MDFTILRTDANHPDFKHLVNNLDRYLSIIDGDEHAFYAQFNKIDFLKQVVIEFIDGKAIACGAIKKFDEEACEVKRMFVDENFRGLGLASKILKELENWTKELGFKKCVLETGIKQDAAVKLYKKNGYQIIPNYGQYIGVTNSVCMEKNVI